MIKRLAIVDQIGNTGGGNRFIRCLLPGLKRVQPSMEITFFCNKASIKRDQLQGELAEDGVIIKYLNTEFIQIAQLIYFILSKSKSVVKHSSFLLPSLVMKLLRYEMELRITNFDVAFFPWPFLLFCPNLNCPMVATFHDFNFRYYFSGTFTYNPFQQYLLDQETPRWLKRSFPVVSTYFMENELKKFYPETLHQPEVIHLASFSTKTSIPDADAIRIVSDDFKIEGDYLLYPTNICSHKNIGPLIQAIYILRKMNRNVKLILTGPATERITGRNSAIGIELGQRNYDVRGLGYVSNLQMDALIQRAKVVVSSSLYEAGNGPGIDAWARAIPVAMSDIPPFIEHIKVQDVKAQVFDPRNPQDIADKINIILSNPEKALEDALYSQKAMQKFTWEKVAEKYLAVFNKARMEVHK
ncbi:MAG: glycosyltransferase [Syntrophaceae bacterium]|nr:glycosyltransferase [Syntrophaceae bacterium]